MMLNQFNRIPLWYWLLVPVLAFVAVGIRGATQASYFKGIADAAEPRLVVQQEVIDSVSSYASNLTTQLVRADSALATQRRQNAEEVARLTRSRQEARKQSEALSTALRASLDSAQATTFDEVVQSYEKQIESLEKTIAIERSVSAAERLRATQATELVLTLESVIAEQEVRYEIMTTEIVALRSAMQPSLGLRIKADWWLAAVGFAAGALVTR